MAAVDTDMDLEAQVRNVILPHLRFLEAGTEVGVDDALAELGLDSLASIDLLLDLEEAFDTQISDDVITENSFTTINEVVKTMQAALA